MSGSTSTLQVRNGRGADSDAPECEPRGVTTTRPPEPASDPVEQYDEERDIEDLGPWARWASLDLRRRWANGEMGP